VLGRRRAASGVGGAARGCLPPAAGIAWSLMEIDFLKMHGCGDDVVVVDGTRLAEEVQRDFPRLAHRILDRRKGVGGNSLAVLLKREGNLLPVHCFDPEGDERELPCAAARCAARYAADSGAVNTNDFQIVSGGRKMRAQVIDSTNVRVDLGSPVTLEKEAEIRESLRESFSRSVLVNGRAVTYTPISLGPSYAMVFVPDFSFPVRRTGREIAGAPDFPDGTGVAFVQVCSREEIRLRTWETPDEPNPDDCASAAAALVASVVNGLADREVVARIPGGDLFLQWEESDNHIRVTGPAAYVFTGTFDFPEGSPGGAAAD